LFDLSQPAHHKFSTLCRYFAEKWSSTMTKHSCAFGKTTPDNTGPYHKMGLPLLLMALLLLAGFSTSTQAEPGGNITPRIIGGTNANPDDYPWAVALLRPTVSNGFNAQFCGGTLIASRWVLTAAHCVEDLSSASEIEVAIGINNLNNISITDRKTVNNIFVYPAYDTNSQDNDIALLELATPSTNTVLAIADNTLTDNINIGELMTIIGWGTTNANPQTPSFPDLLQETQIPLFDFDICNIIYNNLLTSNMICAGFAAGGKDSCMGDSGGPMLYFNTDDDTYYQTGITSFGNGCAEANKPGVYTHVANHRNWITDTILVSLVGQRQLGYHGINRSTSTTLTLQNTSGADVTISAINLDNPANFTLLSQNCDGATLVNNSSCSITLQFQAMNVGTHMAALSIDFDTATPSINATISATVLASSNTIGLDEIPARPWYSGDNASWFNVITSNSNGGTAMRSGNISDNQRTALLAYFTGPDTLSFRWKSSTEQNFDLLKLYINGVFIDAISGDQDWQQREITLSAGEHRVIWVYEKDLTISTLQDTVWLDSINTSFLPVTPPLPDNTTTIDVSNGGGGKPSEFFLLLLTVILVWRKNHHHLA